MPSGIAPVLTSLSASWLPDGACKVTPDSPAFVKSPWALARKSDAWSGFGNQSSRTVGFAGSGATAADELPLAAGVLLPLAAAGADELAEEPDELQAATARDAVTPAAASAITAGRRRTGCGPAIAENFIF